MPAPCGGVCAEGRRDKQAKLTREFSGNGGSLVFARPQLRPTIVEVLIDPFLAAQLSNAVLAAQAFQHRIFSSAGWCRRVARRISRTVFSALSGTRLLACLIVAPQRGYDEPGILSYAISSFCPISADGLHHGD